MLFKHVRMETMETLNIQEKRRFRLLINEVLRSDMWSLDYVIKN